MILCLAFLYLYKLYTLLILQISPGPVVNYAVDAWPPGVTAVDHSHLLSDRQ